MGSGGDIQGLRDERPHGIGAETEVFHDDIAEVRYINEARRT